MTRNSWFGMVLTGAITMVSSAVFAAPVAVVTDMQGKAVGESKPVALLAEVEGDARVQLDASARMVVVYYSSGTEYSLRGPAVIQFKAAGPEAVSGNPPEKRQAALTAGAKEVKLKPGGLARAAYMMMGAPSALKLLELTDTRSLEAKPELRWAALDSARHYEVRVTREGTGTVFATTTTGTSVRFPNEVSLEPDVKYTWRVAALLRDGTRATSVGEFSIVPDELRAEVVAARPAESAPLSQKVAYALWLEQLELRDEARKYWDIARGQRPNDATLEALASKQ
ncbi:MAG TPA: hypothetical protein VED01_13255 [Burkholderiales bacterium]|nr:hypothetical protein [Burkholderiales bacterium]